MVLLVLIPAPQVAELDLLGVTTMIHQQARLVLASVALAVTIMAPTQVPQALDLNFLVVMLIIQMQARQVLALVALAVIIMDQTQVLPAPALDHLTPQDMATNLPPQGHTSRV